jgi:nicotine blue oxidoreductase
MHDGGSRVAGLILAGGEGRRFGQPKAFARLDDGRTFLEACAATLIGAGASPVTATMPPGAEDPRIEGVEVIALLGPGLDMFGSLRSGLARLIESPAWRTVAVLAVDHPLVRDDTVRSLAATGERAAIPSFRGKPGHPVCLARSVVEDLLGGKLPGSTLREILRSVDAIHLSVDDVGVISNCNTPEALREALRAREE